MLSPDTGPGHHGVRVRVRVRVILGLVFVDNVRQRRSRPRRPRRYVHNSTNPFSARASQNPRRLRHTSTPLTRPCPACGCHRPPRSKFLLWTTPRKTKTRCTPTVTTNPNPRRVPLGHLRNPPVISITTHSTRSLRRSHARTPAGICERIATQRAHFELRSVPPEVDLSVEQPDWRAAVLPSLRHKPRRQFFPPPVLAAASQLHSGQFNARKPLCNLKLPLYMYELPPSVRRQTPNCHVTGRSLSAPSPPGWAVLREPARPQTESCTWRTGVCTWRSRLMT